MKKSNAQTYKIKNHPNWLFSFFYLCPYFKYGLIEFQLQNGDSKNGYRITKKQK